MLTTVIIVLLLVFFATLINSIPLLIGILLLKVPKPGFRQIYACSIGAAILYLLVGCVIYKCYDRGAVLRTIALAGGIAATAIVPPILLRYHFRQSWIKSAGVFAFWLAGSVVFGFLGFICAAVATQRTFVVPTNGMAPTIRGSHRVGTCEHCGGVVIISVSSDSSVEKNAEGICSACWKFGEASDIQPETLAGDRFFAGRLLKPKRWDIVTFHPPIAPDVLYVQRVVGLPGETVMLKGGQLWINGTAQPPPAGLENLVYAGSKELSAEQGFDNQLIYGVEDKPCHLAADECFVLGDNTFRSMDARFFGPVKMDQVIGVATVRYWPLDRTGSLRH